jgi:hypothetical protein
VTGLPDFIIISNFSNGFNLVDLPRGIIYFLSI